MTHELKYRMENKEKCKLVNSIIRETFKWLTKKSVYEKRDKRVSANVANFASKSLPKYDDPR